jgi:ABC-type sulfate/molybdate transport systems ATPase subunit
MSSARPAAREVHILLVDQPLTTALDNQWRHDNRSR